MWERFLILIGYKAAPSMTFYEAARQITTGQMTKSQAAAACNQTLQQFEKNLAVNARTYVHGLKKAADAAKAARVGGFIASGGASLPLWVPVLIGIVVVAGGVYAYTYWGTPSIDPVQATDRGNPELRKAAGLPANDREPGGGPSFYDPDVTVRGMHVSPCLTTGAESANAGWRCGDDAFHSFCKVKGYSRAVTRNNSWRFEVAKSLRLGDGSFCDKPGTAECPAIMAVTCE